VNITARQHIRYGVTNQFADAQLALRRSLVASGLMLLCHERSPDMAGTYPDMQSFLILLFVNGAPGQFPTTAVISSRV
jgi:hypothetical protein